MSSLELLGEATVLPWTVAGAGLSLIATGLVLTLHGIGQRRPSVVARIGLWVVTLGVSLALGTVGLNKTVQLVQSLNDELQNRTVHASEKYRDVPTQ